MYDNFRMWDYILESEWQPFRTKKGRFLEMINAPPGKGGHGVTLRVDRRIWLWNGGLKRNHAG